MKLDRNVVAFDAIHNDENMYRELVLRIAKMLAPELTSKDTSAVVEIGVLCTILKYDEGVETEVGKSGRTMKWRVVGEVRH